MTNPPLHVRGILIQMALVTSAQQLFAKGAEVATKRRFLLSQPGVVHLRYPFSRLRGDGASPEADPETTVLGRSTDLRHAQYISQSSALEG